MNAWKVKNNDTSCRNSNQVWSDKMAASEKDMTRIHCFETLRCQVINRKCTGHVLRILNINLIATFVYTTKKKANRLRLMRIHLKIRW